MSQPDTVDEQGLDDRGRWRCSLAARERGDERVGTAVPAPRWFLVGHRGPWAQAAAQTAPLDAIAGELAGRLSRAGARLQLIRRHGRPEVGPDVDGGSDGDQPVFLVDCLAGTIGRGTWREPADLLDLVERFADPPEVVAEPLVLVCAHGRRDQCCAIEGRLVAAVLDDVMPGAVWETTHLGGDRFAANVAYLPEGSMYGGLTGSTATEVLLRHVDGEVTVDHWRGRCVWTSPVQAAVADVLREGVRLAQVERTPVVTEGPDSWVVTVVAGGAAHPRRVVRTMGPQHRLTCQPELKRAAVYTVTRV